MYNQQNIEKVKEFMISHKQTIAVAESVTAGHLQAALSCAVNARQFFQGGITAYNIGQKSRHLHIEPIHAEGCNCVSETVAQQMAINVTGLFSCDYGIAITGFASVAPEIGVNELYAYYAIAQNNKVVKEEKIFPSADVDTNDGVAVQIFYTNEVFKALCLHLNL